MNRLRGLRCYLAGPMEFADDYGAGWRDEMGEFLESLGVIVINPIKTTHKNGLTEVDLVRNIKEAKETQDYEQLTQIARDIRTLDLRFVDVSDFIIGRVNQNIKMCGTWEELFTANRQKKPILLNWEGGKDNASTWILGTIDHNDIYDNWEDIKNYLIQIDNGSLVPQNKRWVFLHEHIHHGETDEFFTKSVQ